MTTNERAWHDWFDQELDRLQTEPVELNDELTRTAVLMQRLDTNQQSPPDESFVRALENQLMPFLANTNASTVPQPTGPNRELLNQVGARLTTERTQHRRVSRLASAFSILLLLAVIAATALFALSSGNDGHKQNSANFPVAVPPTAAAQSTPYNAPNESPFSAALPSYELSELWRSEPLADGIGYANRIAAGGGVIYRVIASSSGESSEIQALSASDGTELWRVESEWALSLVADDQGVYVESIPSSDNAESARVTALDKSSGSELWAVPYSSKIISMNIQPSALSSGATTVLTKDADNIATAINAESGEIIWSTQLAPNSALADIGIVQIISNGDIVVGQATNGALVGLDFTTGEILWRLMHADANDLEFVGGILAVLATGTTTADVGESMLSAYDARQGLKLWSRAIEGSIGRGWFGLATFNGVLAVIAQSLDEPEFAPLASPTAQNVSHSSNTTAPLGSIPNISAVYGVDPISGATVWVSNWTSTETTIRSNALTANAAIVQAIPSSDGVGAISVVTSEGAIGVLTPPTAEDGTPPLLGFKSLQIVSPFQMRDSFRDLATDNSSVFVELGDGTIVAYELTETP